jgi:hypothetical protein
VTGTGIFDGLPGEGEGEGSRPEDKIEKKKEGPSYTVLLRDSSREVGKEEISEGLSDSM